MKSLYFSFAYVFLFSAKTRIYKQNKHTYTQSGAENSLCLTITEPRFYLEDMKNYLSLVISRAINQVIMRVHKPKVEYKLALPTGKTSWEHLGVLL